MIRSFIRCACAAVMAICLACIMPLHQAFTPRVDSMLLAGLVGFFASSASVKLGPRLTAMLAVVFVLPVFGVVAYNLGWALSEGAYYKFLFTSYCGIVAAGAICWTDDVIHRPATDD